MPRTAKSFSILLSILLLTSAALRAQWVQNGIPVCTETYYQLNPRAAADGAGGAIITWRDNRTASPGASVYAQRVDGWGNIIWASGGIPMYSTYPTFLAFGDPEIASDGAGGAFVVWTDDRSGDVDLYAQRIDAEGTELWAAGGLLICDWAGDQVNYAVTCDGEGAMIVAWQDGIFGSNDIFAQKIDADGTAQWTADGTEVCTNMFDQFEPRLVSDGDGGAIIVWDDRRTGPSDIYAQRIDAGGAAAWTADGKIICNAVNSQRDHCIVPDDWGGAIIAWSDYRNSADWPIYAQRVNRSGNMTWTANGIAVSTTVTDMTELVMVPDGRNGAILTWVQAVGISPDIYAQRISYLGYREWNAGGTAVCSSTGTQRTQAAVADGDGGVVIAWQDYRNGTDRDIYAQRLSSEGLPAWPINGVSVSGGADDQVRVCIASDGIGGAIMAWEQWPGSTPDLYAQRIERFGYWGYPSPTITSVSDVPSDQGGHVTVTWDKSRIETFMAVIIDRYSVWRMLPEAGLEALISSGAKSADPAKLDRAAEGPVFYISEADGEAAAWELMDYVDATNSGSYSDEVETLFDSTAADPGLHHFMVMAHGTDHFAFWESQPGSGCSVDNIAPMQPESFSGEQSFDPPGLTLSWGSGPLRAPAADIDIAYYALYRDVLPDFMPGKINLIHTGLEMMYFDDEWHWGSGFYYKLSAVDIHGNASGFAFIAPEDVTGSETPELPDRTYLEQNAPNPFNPATTIQFGLASPGRVTLSIFDVSGRPVRTLVDETRAAGLYRETWNGLDQRGRSVASGVYFYRLRSGTFIETRKMVLAR